MIDVTARHMDQHWDSKLELSFDQFSFKTRLWIAIWKKKLLSLPLRVDVY